MKLKFKVKTNDEEVLKKYGLELPQVAIQDAISRGRTIDCFFIYQMVAEYGDDEYRDGAQDDKYMLRWMI